MRVCVRTVQYVCSLAGLLEKAMHLITSPHGSVIGLDVYFWFGV